VRRITLWLLATVAGLVLLFSYRTSTMGAGGGVATAAGAVPAPGAGATDDPDGGARPDGDSADQGTVPADPGPATAPAPAGTPTPGGGSGAGSTTYPGSTVQTRWGPIQVTVTVAGGRITDVAVPVYPNGNQRDAEINAYALPALREATLTAQSAGIDTVSGATVTSDGYKQSLQSALDAAHLS
jgi:hypothetical protein